MMGTSIDIAITCVHTVCMYACMHVLYAFANSHITIPSVADRKLPMQPGMWLSGRALAQHAQARGLYACVSAAHVCIDMLACARVCGDQRFAPVSVHVTFYPTFLSRGLSLNLELTVLARVAVSGTLLSLPLVGPSLQVYTATSGFGCGS